MGWSQPKAGEHLGVSRRTVQMYEKGELSVPLAVELACEALTRGVRRYAGPEESPASPALAER